MPSQPADASGPGTARCLSCPTAVAASARLSLASSADRDQSTPKEVRTSLGPGGVSTASGNWDFRIRRQWGSWEDWTNASEVTRSTHGNRAGSTTVARPPGTGPAAGGLASARPPSRPAATGRTPPTSTSAAQAAQRATGASRRPQQGRGLPYTIGDVEPLTARLARRARRRRWDDESPAHGRRHARRDAGAESRRSWLLTLITWDLPQDRRASPPAVPYWRSP